MMKTLYAMITLMALLFAPMVYAGQVNINSADAQTLAAELKGVGEKKAQLIVDYRQKHGAFKSVDELENVKGISMKTIEKNKANIAL
jgi:competence protein ComEA